MNGIVTYDGKLNEWVITPEVAKKMENIEKQWFEIFKTLHEYQNCFDGKRVMKGTIEGGIPATIVATTGDRWGCGQQRVLLSLEKNRLYLYRRYGLGGWNCKKEIDVKEGCFLELFRHSFFTLPSLEFWLHFRRFLLPVVIPIKLFFILVYRHIIPTKFKRE